MKLYLLVDEDGDVHRKTALEQEDLCNFDQSTVTNIIELDVVNETTVTIKRLETVDSDEADEDTPEDEQYDGTKYKAVDWKVVPTA